MKVFGLCLVILVGTVMLVPGVMAQHGEKNPGYHVSPAGNLHMPAGFTTLITASIIQGETDWYYYYVPSGTPSIITDLDWSDSSDSLSLTIIAPDQTLGPYYDAADGSTNGRISLEISRAGDLAPGTWTFRVYGAQVSGTRWYNFNVY